MKKCPFTGRDCVGENCMGWIGGDCFIKKLIRAGAKTEARPAITKKSLILGVDFGTAYTKIQVRDEKEKLRILRDSTGKALAISSDVYIDKDGYVYFGSMATEQAIQDMLREQVEEALFFSGLKMSIINAANRNEMRDLEQRIREKLGSLQNPPSPFTIITYSIAYSLAEAQRIFKKSFNEELSLDQVMINFSNPSLELQGCFLPDPDNPVRQIRYEKYIGKAVARALYLSQYIESDKCSFEHLWSHTTESRKFAEKLAEKLNWDYEPACALSEILRNYPEAEDGIYILIDIGAGTTDIGVFLKRSPADDRLLLHNSEPMGDNQVDNMFIQKIETLREKEIKLLTVEQYQIFKSFLKRQIKVIKEKLIKEETYKLEFSGLFLTPLELSLSTFDSELEEYFGQISKKLGQRLSNIRFSLYQKGYEQPRKVFVSGGGSFLLQKYRIIDELIEKSIHNIPVIYTSSNVGISSELSGEDMCVQVVALGLAHNNVRPSYPPPYSPTDIDNILKRMPDYTEKEVQ